jgi:hypothetical protein
MQHQERTKQTPNGAVCHGDIVELEPTIDDRQLMFGLETRSSTSAAAPGAPPAGGAARLVGFRGIFYVGVLADFPFAALAASLLRREWRALDREAGAAATEPVRYSA